MEFVLDVDYQETVEEDDEWMIMTSDGDKARFYLEGNKAVLCYLKFPYNKKDGIEVGLGNRKLSASKRPRLLHDRFDLFSDQKLFAQISTNKLSGSGTMTVFEDLPLKESIPLTVIASRLGYYFRK